MALSDGHPRTVTKDGNRRAFSTQGSPAPLRDIPLQGGDDHSLTPPPVPSANTIPSARSESLPSPYPSGSVSSFSASNTTLRASSSSRTQRTQSASRRSTPGDSPTNGTGRRLPSTNANASSTSLSATVSKSPRVPVPDPPPRFRAIPHLPNVQNVETAWPPVMYWSKAPVWGALPTHGFRAHTVTLADNVAWIFGGCDDKGCFKDMWCFNIETMQWTHPEMQGDLPPPCRAHSATFVGRKIVIIGGGENASYYNSVHVFRHSDPALVASNFHHGRRPTTTTVLYQTKSGCSGL